LTVGVEKRKTGNGTGSFWGVGQCSRQSEIAVVVSLHPFSMTIGRLEDGAQIRAGHAWPAVGIGVHTSFASFVAKKVQKYRNPNRFHS